jgi:DNA polymerase IV (DinB-like DNA polymerase)
MNRAHYEEISDRIMETLEPVGDAFERVGIDEAYLELTSKVKGDFQQAAQMGNNIKRLILEQEHITSSIGIAPNKLLAKIASDRGKPNGLTIVRPEDVIGFLRELPVISIPGVGRKTEEKLEQLNAKTINQLATLNASVLREAFGISLGTYLYQAARGSDDEPVVQREQPTQISRIATLKRNTHDISEILPLLKDVAQSAATKLNEKGMSCRTISIIAILDDLSIHSKSKTLESMPNDEEIIAQASRELMEQFLESMPTATVRRVGVKLSGLAIEGGQTDISKFLG